MDADGGNPTQLTTTNGIFDAFPEWSPDGTKIAFTSDRAALDDIWVMDLTARTGPPDDRQRRSTSDPTGPPTARRSRSPASAGTSG